jgi:hypothetical protein
MHVTHLDVQSSPLAASSAFVLDAAPANAHITDSVCSNEHNTHPSPIGTYWAVLV